MPDFKVVISLKDGKSVQKEVKDPHAKSLMGKKLGDKIKGDDIDLAGYEFQITGGSDYCGFPMRRDVSGTMRKKILAVGGVGIKGGQRGQLQRKTVCGNTVYAKTAQINVKVLKEGKAKLIEEKPAVEKKEEKAKA